MSKGIRRKSGISTFEILVSLIVIFIFIGFLAGYLGRVFDEAQKMALKQTLNGVRASLRLYNMRNAAYPQDLRQLLSEEYTLSRVGKEAFREKYLKSCLLDEEGCPKDPFGNRLDYDPETGIVSSTTKGYSDW